MQHFSAFRWCLTSSCCVFGEFDVRCDRYSISVLLLVTCIGPCARMTHTSLEDGFAINYATDCCSRWSLSGSWGLGLFWVWDWVPVPVP